LAKRRLLASVAGAALAAGGGASPAAAQTANWSGFYSGLYAGAAWTRSDATTTVPCTEPNTPPAYLCTTTPNTVSNAVAASGTGKLFDTHFTGGVHAGYNWQAGNFVFGGEVDFGAFLLNASRSVTARYPIAGIAGQATTNSYTVGTSVDGDWLFTARGRVGFTTANRLFYATGGLALARLTVANTFSDDFTTGARGSGSASSIRVGWTVGGGIERLLSKDWSVKVEYLYVNFGSLTALGLIRHAAGYSQALNTSFDVSTHIVRAGFNYHF
jgi:outer membrane immunogenic protein